MAQAHETRDRLIAAHGWASEAITIVPVTASGDKVAGSLADAGGKALWTKELDQWLHDGEIDFAVHCLKDMETIRPAFLTIAAILPREDVRDCLITGPGGGHQHRNPAPWRAPGHQRAAPRVAGAASAPGSDNRAHSRQCRDAAGQIGSGDADATLLAMAGLNRLDRHVGSPLSAQTWLPAAGQAAIAIETRSDNKAVQALLAPWTMRPPAMPCWARGPCWRLWAAHATARSPF
jgi:hydroxymethylbilane synthase